MKQRKLKGALLLIIMGALSISSCEDRMNGDAYISFLLSSDYSSYSMDRLTQKLKSEGTDIVIPDTSEFILSVIQEDGEPVYEGPYGDRPDPMQVAAGTYDVALYSSEFDEPAFSSPQFGDYRTVVIGSGQTLSVAFGCTQLNCGMRLQFTDSFRDRFFSSDILIRSEEHSLAYPYTEKRIAYFQPGILRVISSEDGQETALLSRQLSAADILTVKLSASAESSGAFSIEIDTSRNWIFEDFTIGSGNNGSSMENALTITDLAMNLGAEDVWVGGYIVGGDVTTANLKLEPPFTKASHIALSDNAGASSRGECAAAELPDGDVRESLNLIDHPDILGKRLYIKGDVEEYFGYPGIKNIKDFHIE